MSTTKRSVDVDICGELVTLPVVPISDDTSIALLLCVDQGVLFTERVGRLLAGTLVDHGIDVVVSIATMGIPLAIEVSRSLGLDHYVILHKTNKIHLADALTATVRSITTNQDQTLRLDRTRAELLRAKRVAIIDDVISTGGSMVAALGLVRAAGGEVTALGAIATEGERWKDALGDDATLVRALGALPLLHL